MPAAELGCKSWYIEFAKFVKKVTKPKPLATFIKTLIQLWKNLIESSQKCRFTQGWCWTLGKPSYWWVQWSSGRGDPIKKEGKLTFLFCFSHFLFSFFAFLIFVFFFPFLIFCFLFYFSHVLFSDAAFSFHSLPSVAPLSFSTRVGWGTSLHSFGSHQCCSSYHLITCFHIRWWRWWWGSCPCSSSAGSPTTPTSSLPTSTQPSTTATTFRSAQILLQSSVHW